MRHRTRVRLAWGIFTVYALVTVVAVVRATALDLAVALGAALAAWGGFIWLAYGAKED